MRSSILHTLVLLLPLTVLGVFPKRDGLSGHGGIFSALDWTEDELAEVSRLHAAANYPAVMRLVKDKLIDSDISYSEKKRIENFMRKHRPPRVFNPFLDEDQTLRAYAAHHTGDVGSVLGVIMERFEELPRSDARIAQEYMMALSPNE